MVASKNGGHKGKELGKIASIIHRGVKIYTCSNHNKNRSSITTQCTNNFPAFFFDPPFYFPVLCFFFFPPKITLIPAYFNRVWEQSATKDINKEFSGKVE